MAIQMMPRPWACALTRLGLAQARFPCAPNRTLLFNHVSGPHRVPGRLEFLPLPGASKTTFKIGQQPRI